MSHRITLLALAAAGIMSLAAGAAQADTYDWSSLAQGTTVTPFTMNGATFSSSNDPGGFTVGSNGGLYSTLTNSVISSAGTPATLDITFGTALTGISFNFATGDFLGLDGGDSLTFTTNTGLTQTVTAISLPSGDSYVQGLFNLSGAAAFTSVTISASDALGAQSLILGNLTTTAVPLPATAWLLVSGLGGAAGFMRRRKAA